jgi:hypothetical protein
MNAALLCPFAAPEYDRLSRTRIWDVQRSYFEEQGPRAWSSGAVPHYVTSNPYLAQAFAEFVLGFARDLGHAPEPGCPLHVVELGAGCGRLGYHLARALIASPELRALGWRPVYVLTDLSERTVDWWRAHPWLAPLIAAGHVDVARLDLERDTELVLRASGRVLSPDAPAGAMVVVANYLFDSLPQDAFTARGGALFERVCRAEVTADVAGAGFAHVELAFEERPAEAAGYYGDERDALLGAYRGVEGAFTFPCAALRALARLRDLAGGPLLVLSADRGGAWLDDVVDRGDDECGPLALHGSASMTVNYHAIGAWSLAHGGAWMHLDHDHRALEVCAFVLGLDERASTLGAYERAIARRGPDDFYSVKRIVARHHDDLDLSELLAYLRLSGHDPKLFLDSAPAIRRALTDASARDKADLALVIARTWDAYFPIGEEHDLAAALAQLCVDLGRWRDAIALYAESIALHGERSDVARRLAVCHAAIDDAHRPG